MSADMPTDIARELRLRAAYEQIPSTIFERAADEIERLRAELSDAWRKSSQALVELSSNLCATSARERERITAERDEARRLYCKAVEEIERGMSNDSARDVAKARHWDCFDNYTEEEVANDGSAEF